MRTPVLIAALLAAAAAAAAVPSAVLAHAHMKTSAPAADSTVAAPREIRVGFTEPVVKAFTTLALRDAAGKPVTLGAATLQDGDRTVAAPAPALAPGLYRVEWKAVAVDTHKSSGGFAFTVR